MPGPDDHDRIPEPVPPAQPGEFDYDDVQRGDRIGTGGDADVYRGTVTRDGTDYPVAIKEPRIEDTVQRRVLEGFRQEAETWQRIDDHDNVVSVYGWGADPVPWIAMEYMDGGPLSRKLGAIDVPEALWLAGRIAEGVRHGQRHGVAHLDLKPANLLLRETGDGTWDYPKVSDWGLAKLLLEHSNSVEGFSPTYAAPEQFDAEEFGDPDDFTDVYQLGAVAYALLTGEPPFTGSAASVMRAVMEEDPVPPSEAAPGVPAALDDVVLKALEKEKGDRYDGILTFRQALDRAFAEVTGDGGGTAAVVGAPGGGTPDRGGRADAPDDGVAADPDPATVPGTGSDDRATESGRGDTGSSPGNATGSERAGDGSSIVTRRRLLGVAGVGALGAGGLLAGLGALGNGGGSAAGPADDSPDPGPGAAATTGRSRTTTVAPTTDPGTTEPSTTAPDPSTTTERTTTTTPETTTTTAETTTTPAPGSSVVFDNFERTDRLGWTIERGERSQLEFSSDSVRGDKSLHFIQSDRDVSTTIFRDFENWNRFSRFSIWFKYRSENDNQFNIKLRNRTGNLLGEFRVFYSAVHYRDTDKRGGSVPHSPLHGYERSSDVSHSSHYWGK